MPTSFAPSSSHRRNAITLSLILALCIAYLGLSTTSVLSSNIPESSYLSQARDCGRHTSCSPLWCVPISNSQCYNLDTKKTISMFAQEVIDMGCKVCSQSTLAVCQTQLMKSTFQRKKGVQLAYCNDEYLVLHSTGMPSHQTSFDAIPRPPLLAAPKSNQIEYLNPGVLNPNRDAASCAVRSYSPSHIVNKVPLFPKELPSAAASNNLKYFQNGRFPRNIQGKGLPEEYPVGVSISGQAIYHMYSTVTTVRPASIVSNAVTSVSVSDVYAQCQVDKCSGYSGADFVYRYAGDPFSSTPDECLYSPADYESQYSHPPLVGWALDGFEIFGRHLFLTSLGANEPLDTCGGHVHRDGRGNAVTAYHYHAQVIDMTIPATASSPIRTYKAHVAGVLNCFKGDIEAARYFGNNNASITGREDFELLQPCCSTSDVYTSSDKISLNLKQKTIDISGSTKGDLYISKPVNLDRIDASASLPDSAAKNIRKVDVDTRNISTRLNRLYITKTSSKDGVIDSFESPYILWNDAASITDSTPTLRDVNRIDSSNQLLQVTLNVKPFRLVSDSFAFNTRAFCYLDECSVPGPSLYVVAGDRVKITLINDLLPDSVDSPRSSSAAASVKFGVMGAPNRTNIFISGIDIDPESMSFSKFAAGGKTINYEFVVGESTPPGMYTYQSLVPGSAALHALGGLVGAFIVTPKVPSQVPLSMQQMSKTTIVLTHAMIDSSAPFIGGTMQDTTVDSSLSYKALSSIAKSNMNLDITVSNKQLMDVWLTNGQYQPKKSLRPSEWLMINVLVASGDRYIDLSLVATPLTGKTGDNIRKVTPASTGCSMRLLATDGAYLETTRLVDHLTLPPGSRATISVMCNEVGTVYLVSSASVNDNDENWSVGDFDSKSVQPVLVLQVSGTRPGDIYAPPSTINTLNDAIKPEVARRRYAANEVTEKWEIALDNSGAAQALNVQPWSLPLASNNEDPLFWVGFGADCSIPCDDRESCIKRFGESHSVIQYASVLQKTCSFKHSNSFDFKSFDQGVAEVTFYSNSLTSVVSIQGVVSQFISHDDGSGVDLIQKYYGIKAGDWKDAIIIRPGKTVVRFKTFPGVRAIYSRILKYTDRGFVGYMNSRFTSVISDASMAVVNRIVDNSVPLKKQNAAPPPISLPTPPQAEKIIATSATIYDSRPEDTCSALGESFRYEEVLDSKRRVRIIRTSSCPNHFSVCQHSYCGGSNNSMALVKNVAYEVPLYPMFSSIIKDTTCDTNPVAIALNGVPVLGPDDTGTAKTRECVLPDQYGAKAVGYGIRPVSHVDGRTSCPINGPTDGTLFCGDAVVADANEMDACGGHTDSIGGYHYHVTPSCLIKQLEKTKVFNTINVGHSPQIGWAIDGFPLYGPLGPKGIRMARCNSTAAHKEVCLDVCNGYYGALTGYDSFVYRYYMTGPISSGDCDFSGRAIKNSASSCDRTENPCCVDEVPTRDFYPYSIGCLRGCPTTDPLCVKTGMRGFSPDYRPAVSKFPTTIAPNNVWPKSLAPAVVVPPASPSVVTTFQLSAQQAALKTKYDALRDSYITNSNKGGVLTSPNSNPDQSVNLVENGVAFASRDPFNRSINLMQYVYKPNALPLAPPDDHKSRNTVMMQSIPTSDLDFYVTDMTLFKNSNTSMYIATPSVLYSYVDKNDGAAPKEVLGGHVIVEVGGFYFGSSYKDVSILYKNEECLDVILYNSSFVSCSFTSLAMQTTVQNANGVIEPSDVVIRIKNSGETIGLTPDVRTEIMTRSRRPITTAINVYWKAILPYSISHAYDKVSEVSTVYFSSIAAGEFGIKRFYPEPNSKSPVGDIRHGSQLETVITGSTTQLVKGLAVMSSVDLISTFPAMGSYGAGVKVDVIFYTDVVTASLYRLIVPIMVEDVIYQNDYYSSSSSSSRNTNNFCGWRNYDNADRVSFEGCRQICNAVNFGSPVPIITNIVDPGHVEVDLKEGALFLGTFRGALLKIDLLSALNVGFPASSSGCLAPSIDSSDVSVAIKPVVLPSSFRNIQVKNVSQWVQVVYKANSACRSLSYNILPTYYHSFNPYGGHKTLLSRAMILDINTESIVFIDEFGFLNKVVDLGSSLGRYSVKWPSVICSYIRNFDIVNGGTRADVTIVVYAAEYLGKIRKFELSESVTLRPATSDVKLVGTPSTLVDRSSFPVSIEIRKYLSLAQNEGEIANRKIIFDIVY